MNKIKSDLPWEEEEMNIEKPPRGLRPRLIYLQSRLFEIQEAIVRYTEQHRTIPLYWLEEYRGIINQMREEKFYLWEKAYE